MKKCSIIFSIILMLAGAVPASAYTIDTSFASAPNGLDGNTGYTSPYAGVAVETFEGISSWSWTGNGVRVSGSIPGLYAAPFGQGYADNTQYLTVPYSFDAINGDPIVTAENFGTANYLGLWWGSMDAYNSFNFYYQGALVESFTGADVITQGAAFGDQVSYGSNHYVNFVGLPNFDKVTFASSQFAFEVDNVAIGQVPEPTTMILLGLGLIGMAGVRRFKK